MKRTFGVLLLFLTLVTIFTAPGAGAADGLLQTLAGGDQQVANQGAENSFTEKMMREQLEKSQTGSGDSRGQKDLKSFLREQKDDRELKDKREPLMESSRKSMKVHLRGEADDSLVTLNWRVSGMQPKSGEPPARFVLHYGTEPGRYEKRLDVGSVTDYKVRNLQNDKAYYLKVEALFPKADDNQQWGVFPVLSNEIRLTPRPAEELGSPLEKIFAEKTVTLQESREAEPVKRELRQFGYDFFRNSLSTTTPSENIPVGDDYILGPGDSLQIDIWGAVQARTEVLVDRNGEIPLPKMGNVKVWGLTLREARGVINKTISRYYRGYELNITLGRLRSIQVFVVGSVEAPGTYSISSLGTVLNALSMAKGPAKEGSLRTVRLVRGGKTLDEVDLYDMFLTGDRKKDVRLENGDTLFVPVIGPVVAVAGEVKRPAIYELRHETSLKQVIDLAGGITAAGDPGKIQMERFEHGSRVVLDLDNGSGKDAPLDKIKVSDRDMIKVFPVNKALRGVVTLSGSVTRPGDYQFREGMRLSDLLPSHELLLPDSYLEAGEIIRLVPPDLHKETLTFDLDKVLRKDGQEDLLLKEQDTVRIFSRWDMVERPFVSIFGQVVKPDNYEYFPKMTVRDLVVAAGSLKRNAFLDSAELTRTVMENGKATVSRFAVNLTRALAGETADNLELQPDDVLIVRGVAEWLDSSDRFATIKGEVKFPGTYSITKGESLSSLIARAGGFTDKAYMKGARFTRKAVQLDQQKRLDQVIARAEQDILKKQGELASLASSREELEATRASLEGLAKSLEKMKTLRAEGRVVIRLAPLEQFRNGPYDVELAGGDLLEVPATPSVVNVMGQVYNPTSFLHMKAKSIDYYLKKAGGPTRDAEDGDMYLIKADGTVVSRQQSTLGIRWDEDSSRWIFGSFMSTSLDQGDTLVVPQKLERVAWLRDIKDITTILSQVALTAGTVLIGLR